MKETVPAILFTFFLIPLEAQANDDNQAAFARDGKLWTKINRMNKKSPRRARLNIHRSACTMENDTLSENDSG